MKTTKLLIFLLSLVAVKSLGAQITIMPVLVQEGRVAIDQAFFLEGAHAAQRGRLREADFLCQLHVADAAVALQRGENHLVVAIERHDRNLLKNAIIRQKIARIELKAAKIAS